MARPVMIIGFLTICALCAGVPAAALDFGTYGPVWDIKEPNLLETIQRRLGAMEGSGELAQMEREMQETTRSYVNRPRPVQGLLKAEVARQFEVDLSITVSRDLMDHQGRVFAAAGTVINPLHYSRFNQRIVLFDGDDPAQVAFALSEGNEVDTVLVLVNGAPLELMREHARRFYFDQDAQLVSKFQIERVPSVVTRGTDFMQVTEVPVGETQE